MSDKSNLVVVIDRSTYNKIMESTLSDQSKFLKVDDPDNSLLKFSINQEKHIGPFLESVKDK